jgi:ribose transport system substrate-binding protein
MTTTRTRRFWLTAATAVGAGTLVLTACGTESDAPSAGGQPPSRSCKGADADYLIGMSQANVGEPYRQQMNDDIAAAAKQFKNFDVKFADAAQDNSKQVSDVENFLTQGIDLLIISPNEATPLTAVVKKAYDKGVPVIVLDRKVDGDAYTQFIGADNQEIGKRAGEYVAKLLPNGGNVAEIKGLQGSTPAKEREDGFKQGIAANPKVKVVADGVGDWLRDKGQSQAEAILKANADIDLVYAHNDPMAEGAYLAAKAAGKADSIKFIGIDGLPIPSGGIKAVEQGRLAATFVYPTGGKEAIASADGLLNKCQGIEKQVTLQTQQVTKDNAAEVYRTNATS